MVRCKIEVGFYGGFGIFGILFDNVDEKGIEVSCCFVI